MTIRLKLTAFLMIVTFFVQPYAAYPEENSWNQQFQQQLSNWIQNLVKKDQQFTIWKDAKKEVRSLGPNSRQWLVTLSQNGKDVGYLVVGEAPNTDQETNGNPQFVLLEYGLGEFVLFNDAFAPQFVNAQPVYDGFASYWLIADNSSMPHYIDAKTGEKYPSIAQPDKPLMASLQMEDVIGNGKQLTDRRSFVSEEISPFQQIDWIISPSVNDGMSQQATLATLWDEQKPESVIVTASLFHDAVIAPFTVGSVHVWEDSVAYIGVWDWGLRFVPYSYVDKVGELLIN